MRLSRIIVGLALLTVIGCGPDSAQQPLPAGPGQQQPNNEQNQLLTLLKGRWSGYRVTCYAQCDVYFDYYFREPAEATISGDKLKIHTLVDGKDTNYEYDFKISGTTVQTLTLKLEGDKTATTDYLDQRYLYLKMSPESFSSEFDYYVLERE